MFLFCFPSCVILSVHCTQVAERQGRYLAKCLASDMEERKAFEFHSAGMLAYIGAYEGLTDLPDLKVRGE